MCVCLLFARKAIDWRLNNLSQCLIAFVCVPLLYIRVINMRSVCWTGSERAKRTGAVGTRLKESVGINQGLLSLGKVIRALTTPLSTSNKVRENIEFINYVALLILH